MRRSLVLTTALVLALPGQAGAATARVDRPAEMGKVPAPAVIAVEAAPGEVNDVTVEREPSGAVVVRDLGAPLAGACPQIDDHAIRCAAYVLIVVRAGDGDDRVRGGDTGHGGPGDDSLEAMTTAFGGEGNDTITDVLVGAGEAGEDRLMGITDRDGTLDGGAGDDSIVDGAGATTLVPGQGRDVVEAGGGDDIVVDDVPEPGADRLDGGDGGDTLSFGRRTSDGTIDLTAQASSDGDAIAGFEHAKGGVGDDAISGDDGPNLLGGGPGEDRLVGAGGDDRLTGGAGFDRFDAGAGDDVIDALSFLEFPAIDRRDDLDASPEPIGCGPGIDAVTALDGDVVAPDCERLPFGLSPRLRIAVTGTSVELRLPCRRPVRVHRRRCRGRVTVQAGPPTAYEPGRSGQGRRRFSIRGRSGRVRVRNVENYAARPLGITVQYAGGEAWSLRWTVPPLR